MVFEQRRFWADFGHLAYGAESAAQLYFGKSAANLDLYEAAILVMISESPALNPIDAPAHSEEMQKEALNRLLLAGLISSDDYIQRLTNFPKFAPAPVLERNRFSAFIDLANLHTEQKALPSFILGNPLPTSIYMRRRSW